MIKETKVKRENKQASTSPLWETTIPLHALISATSFNME